MSERENSIPWRVRVLEDDVKELKRGQPAVIAERVTRLSADVDNLRRDMNEDMGALRSELSSQRRILIGFFASFALVAVAIVIAYLVTGAPVT